MVEMVENIAFQILYEVKKREWGWGCTSKSVQIPLMVLSHKKPVQLFLNEKIFT
jgi:hypothetical protein